MYRVLITDLRSVLLRKSGVPHPPVCVLPAEGGGGGFSALCTVSDTARAERCQLSHKVLLAVCGNSPELLKVEITGASASEPLLGESLEPSAGTCSGTGLPFQDSALIRWDSRTYCICNPGTVLGNQGRLGGM